MLRIFLPTVLAAGIFCTFSAGQLFQKVAEKPDKPKEVKKEPAPADTGVPAAIPGEVDVHFFNGSTVRMIIHSEKLEIATLYGKLFVPVKDVRAIEFGLHFPDGASEKIAAAVKNLGGGNYQEREEASKALIELGPFSFPAVFDASKEKDAEVSRRAQEVVKKLQAKFTKADLKTSKDDRVITAKFTIVGEILTPTIKAKTDYFGEVELSLAKMRNLKAVGGPSLETLVTVDAMKYANMGQWLDSKFRADGKSAIVVTAKGVVDTMPQDGGQYLVGPNGMQATRGGRGGNMFAAARKIVGPINSQNHGGMLIGKIGEEGEPFFIGESYEGSPEAEGNLFLHIGPSPFGCPSSGAFEVKVVRKS